MEYMWYFTTVHNKGGGGVGVGGGGQGGGTMHNMGREGGL